MSGRANVRRAPRLTSVLAAALGLALAGDAAGRPSLDPFRLEQLSRYEVLGFADPFEGGLQRGKAIGVFDATPEEVYRVATDYTRWPAFLPRVKGARVVEATQADALVSTQAELPWPVGMSEVLARYVHDRLPGHIYRVRFALVSGTMRQYQGSLYIEPWGPGKAAITYELVAEPAGYLPRSAINRIIRRSATGFVHALRQRVNDLHREGSLRPLAEEPALQLPLGNASARATLPR